MTTVISTDRAAAVELLRKGEIVALPTETVYGLAADALNPIAVAKIFEAKERPRFDPLIVHLPSRDWLEKVVDLPSRDRKLILTLADNFWPGPLTMVLPKRDTIPDIVTAGLDAVAVRISAHPVFSDVAFAFGKPLAAPSANRFGRVSPTTAQHVFDELDGRIPLIIDAGPTHHGLESTIVSVRGNSIDILRRGPVTAEQLSEFAKVELVASPARKFQRRDNCRRIMRRGRRLRLIDNVESYSPPKNQSIGLLAWYPVSGKERSPDRPAADWRPPLLEVRRGSKSERASRFARGRSKFLSLLARARRARSRSYRCGTSSLSGTRRGDS